MLVNPMFDASPKSGVGPPMSPPTSALATSTPGGQGGAGTSNTSGPAHRTVSFDSNVGGLAVSVSEEVDVDEEEEEDEDMVRTPSSRQQDAGAGEGPPKRSISAVSLDHMMMESKDPTAGVELMPRPPPPPKANTSAEPPPQHGCVVTCSIPRFNLFFPPLQIRLHLATVLVTRKRISNFMAFHLLVVEQ